MLAWCEGCISVARCRLRVEISAPLKLKRRSCGVAAPVSASFAMAAAAASAAATSVMDGMNKMKNKVRTSRGREGTSGRSEQQREGS